METDRFHRYEEVILFNQCSIKVLNSFLRTCRIFSIARESFLDAWHNWSQRKEMLVSISITSLKERKFYLAF